MPFEKIRLSSFRNLEDAEIPVNAERILLIGDNGQGKTNFLEALYYLCYASSFRGSPDAEAIRYGEDSFLLEASIRREAGSSMPPEDILLRCEKGQKDIRRSGKKILDRKELVELNPAVVFCHEDFSFAAGEPERRRFFFDQTAGLVSTGYIDLLRAYRRALKQRNAALKDRRIGLLELLDEQLAGLGLQLVSARKELESELSSSFSGLFERVSLLGKEVTLHFRPSWREEKDIEAVMQRLASKREEELGMGTSLSGPHRDRWIFSCEGRDFASYASTGQLRLLSLVLRSLQAWYYTSRTGSKPVLLLDDVLLELDPEKRRRFVESIPSSSQAFFTFLPGEGWEDFRAASMIEYRVEHGRFADQGRSLPSQGLL